MVITASDLRMIFRIAFMIVQKDTNLAAEWSNLSLHGTGIRESRAMFRHLYLYIFIDRMIIAYKWICMHIFDIELTEDLMSLESLWPKLQKNSLFVYHKWWLFQLSLRRTFTNHLSEWNHQKNVEETELIDSKSKKLFSILWRPVISSSICNHFDQCRSKLTNPQLHHIGWLNNIVAKRLK